MNSLYITGVDDSRPVRTIQAYRRAVEALTGDCPPLTVARETLATFAATGMPIFVGHAEEAVVEAALPGLHDAGCTTAVDLTEEEQAEPVPGWNDPATDEDDDDHPSYAACKAAIVAMAHVDGQPVKVVSLMHGMIHILPEDHPGRALADETLAVMLDSFPFET